MAYTINKFNGTFLVTVQDGTVDTSTDLSLVGKNYAGYGAIENENLIYMLENFANTSPPPKAISGQIWYDSGNKKLKFYDGSRFRVAAGAEASATAPSGLTVGDFWYDTSAKQLHAWTGTDYVLIGPQASPDLGTSSAVAMVVKDVSGTSQTILKMQAGGKVMAIISQYAFELDTSTYPIQDFRYIKKGITLVKTTNDGISTDDNYFWGTASAANGLVANGEFVSAANFIQKGAITFDQEIVFKNAGLIVGDNSDVRLYIDSLDGAVLENRRGLPISVRIDVSDVDQRKVAVFDENGVTPGDDNAYTLGSSGLRWGDIYGVDIYATTLHGNVTGNITGNATGNLIANDSTVLINASTKQIGYDGATIRGNLVGTVSGNVTGTATNATTVSNYIPSIAIPGATDKTSIPVRDTSGNIAATQFIGTANQADRMKINDAASDTDPNYRSAKTSATANTIAARTSSGNLVAVLFDGTATAARYADLAEKYLADAEYESGTVVMIGGDAEVTACHNGSRAIGVVSTDPAFMMNKDLEGGIYIALKGRVPCKIMGPVNKGDDLVAYKTGTARAAGGDDDIGKTFAVALESSDSEGVSVIEVLVL